MVLNYHVTVMSQNGETFVLAVFFGTVTIQILLISCLTYPLSSGYLTTAPYLMQRKHFSLGTKV